MFGCFYMLLMLVLDVKFKKKSATILLTLTSGLQSGQY